MTNHHNTKEKHKPPKTAAKSSASTPYGNCYSMSASEQKLGIDFGACMHVRVREWFKKRFYELAKKYASSTCEITEAMKVRLLETGHLNTADYLRNLIQNDLGVQKPHRVVDLQSNIKKTCNTAAVPIWIPIDPEIWNLYKKGWEKFGATTHEDLIVHLHYELRDISLAVLSEQ